MLISRITKVLVSEQPPSRHIWLAFHLDLSGSLAQPALECRVLHADQVVSELAHLNIPWLARALHSAANIDGISKDRILW